MSGKEDSEPQLPVRTSSRPRKPNNFGDQFICGPTGPTGRIIRPNTRSFEHRGGRKQGQKVSQRSSVATVPIFCQLRPITKLRFQLPVQDVKPRKPRGKGRRPPSLALAQAARWKAAKAAAEQQPPRQEAQVLSPTSCFPEASLQQAAQAGATIPVSGQQAA